MSLFAYKKKKKQKTVMKVESLWGSICNAAVWNPTL